MFTLSPIVILLIGVVTVILLILVLRLNAFIALITAALLVSVLAPGEMGEKVSRVAGAFGEVAGAIGIVIALAAVIGKCLMDSGAADRIVRSFVGLLGEKRVAWALMGSGFVLSVPVFFDTVFYLLVPLARSLGKRNPRNYLYGLAAIGAGAAITHTLVPPTPGPLFVADRLGIDLGVMILTGVSIGLPASIVGLGVGAIINRLMPIPIRPLAGEEESEPLDEAALPPLWLALAPVILPVVLISANTAAKALSAETISEPVRQVAAAALPWTSLLGNPNLALLFSTVIAMGMLMAYRRMGPAGLAKATETALMSGGIVILITAGGGAFGAMLRAAGVQQAVESFVQSEGSTGLAGFTVLLSAFVVASVIKFAQGSGTVAIITTASMFAAMEIPPEALGCHTVYLAMAIGTGSLVGDWMNNSGFWVFIKMGGLTEVEGLKCWTVVTACLGFAGFAFTLLGAWLVPMI